MLVHNQRTLFLILAALNNCACSSMTRYCNISGSDRSNGLYSAAEINIPRTVQTSLIFFKRSYYYLSFGSKKGCYCNTWSYQDDYQLPACVQIMSEEKFFPGKYAKSCMEAINKNAIHIKMTHHPPSTCLFAIGNRFSLNILINNYIEGLLA